MRGSIPAALKLWLAMLALLGMAAVHAAVLRRPVYDFSSDAVPRLP